MNFEDYTIEWDSINSDAESLFITNSSIVDGYEAERQNLNILIVRRKLSFDKLLTDLMAALGVAASSPDKAWIKLSIGLFVICSISPFSIKVFDNSGINDIICLIESDFGDNYINEEKIKKLYKEKPELESVVDLLIRKKIINKPEKGKYYFNGNVLKNVYFK